MIALAIALLRAFASDRASLVLAFIAPISFFSIFAIFFQHLDAPEGMHIEVAVTVRSPKPAAEELADALVTQSEGKIIVTRVPSDASKNANKRWCATIEIPNDFDAQAPKVAIESLLPLPGTSDAIRQLVIAATAAACSEGSSVRAVPKKVEIIDHTRHGALMRASAPGIPILFILLALSSLTARGLGDDEAGLAERLQSLGISAVRRMGARLLALSAIGLAQLATTLLFAMLAFGLVPASPLSLATAAVASACACASFVVVLAEFCGNRSRFAAIAPVCTLSLAGLGGSMVPISLLPESLSWPAQWIFTGWAIDSCVQALDGTFAWKPFLALACFTPACAICAAYLARRNAFR